MSSTNPINPHEDALNSVRRWCSAMSDSVRQKDLQAHMALVSANLRVYGLPGNSVVDYDGFRKRRKFEFGNDKLITLNYGNVRIITSTQRRISFRTKETLLGTDGTLVLVDKNVILEQEDDGEWRMVEDKINHWEVKKLNMETLK
jgi:hypothetical protein